MREPQPSTSTAENGVSPATGPPTNAISRLPSCLVISASTSARWSCTRSSPIGLSQAP